LLSFGCLVSRPACSPRFLARLTLSPLPYTTLFRSRMMRALVVMPVLLVHEQADHLLLRRSPGHASRGGRDVSRIAYLSAYMPTLDRKSTRLNSSHVAVSYAVFCLIQSTGFADNHTR